MARATRQEQIRRQWMLVQALHQRRFGMPVSALLQETGASRATFYRDIEVLQEAGVPVAVKHVNGEARYSLQGRSLPALAPTTMQLAALRLARTLLRPLEGTGFVDELDRLLASWSHRNEQPRGLSLRSPDSHDAGRADLVRTLDDAVRRHRRLRFAHRSAHDPQLAWRTVDPVALRFADDALYLIAWDLDRHAWRTFKVDRIRAPEPTGEPANPHRDDFDEQQLFGHAVKIWHAEPVDVAVRLTPEVAWKAGEYPLIADQVTERQEDGSVIVRATVAGVTEATRWVLGWGAAAEALEPGSLREAVREELEGAVGRYRAQRRPLARAADSRGQPQAVDGDSAASPGRTTR